jgi:hypothetical protein
MAATNADQLAAVDSPLDVFWLVTQTGLFIGSKHGKYLARCHFVKVGSQLIELDVNSNRTKDL